MSALRVGQVVTISGIALRVLALHADTVRCQLEWRPSTGTRHLRDCTVPRPAYERLVAAHAPSPRPFAVLTPLESP